MKKNYFSIALLVLLLAVAYPVAAIENGSRSAVPETPKAVQAIIQKSCFGCHNSESQNDKAKEKLDFKAFDSLEHMNKIKALREIGKAVEEDEMPPKKFLDRYPDRALTADEKKALMDWAGNEAKTLMSK